MKKYIVVLFFLILISGLFGCAAMGKIFPNTIDTQGQPVIGTHTANANTQNAAAMIPYGIGSIVLNGVLFAWNSYEKYKAAKLGKGLNATLAALNQVKHDPSLQADWEKIRLILSRAHTAADVQPLIQNLLSKI